MSTVAHGELQRVPVPRSVRLPTGRATLADLQVGDQVYAVDGTATPVTYLSAVTDRDVLEVVFDDGQVVRCDPEHPWTASTAHSRRLGDPPLPGADSPGHAGRVDWLRVLAATAAAKGAPGVPVEQLAAMSGISVVTAAAFARRAGIPHRTVTSTRPPAAFVPSARPAGPGTAVATLTTAPLVAARTSTVHLYAIDEFLHALANTLEARGPARAGELSPVHVTVTTAVMAATLKATFAVDLPAPVAGAEVDLPVDPYLLGAWLSGNTARFVHLLPPGGAERVMSPIRGMGLTQCPELPAVYLRACATQRMSVLRALVDAGASVLDGAVHLPVPDAALLVGVLELVRSLGIKACAVGAAVQFTTNLPVASEPHLAARLPGTVPKTERRLVVATVRRTGTTAPGRSLQVAHPAHLYLTAGFVPTHNTISVGSVAVGRRDER
jgi:replicative DNA helicase